MDEALVGGDEGFMTIHLFVEVLGVLDHLFVHLPRVTPGGGCDAELLHLLELVDPKDAQRVPAM